MRTFPKIVAIVLIVAGVIQVVAGAVTYYVVHRELSDEKIVVSDDAEYFAGEAVEGPFTAYAQADVIDKHAKEIAGGQTYAQLAQDDPNRTTVMTASFLRASLFTSVVAFGVGALVIGLGVLWVLLGFGLLAMLKSISRLAGERELVPAMAGAGGATAAPVEPAVIPVGPEAAVPRVAEPTAPLPAQPHVSPTPPPPPPPAPNVAPDEV